MLGPEHTPYDERFGFLFNSYYEAVGARHARPERGLITRPGITEIAEYRQYVDAAVLELIDGGMAERTAELLELGLHHEQQHQELLVMDIHHALSRNPLRSPYGELPWCDRSPVAGSGLDRSRRRHRRDRATMATASRSTTRGRATSVLLHPFRIAGSPVTCGDWLAFMADGGYRRPDLWMSDGWHTVQAHGWEAPLYWERRDDEWEAFGLDGLQPVDHASPVVHVSWYEADAFARWAGARLPSEAEWETVAPAPGDPDDGGGWYGAVWQWTASPYVAYPGFRPAAGAVGEYNGKFMVNQHVLRGSCRATPPGHARRTYRNFFPPHARWAFSGVRLASD